MLVYVEEEKLENPNKNPQSKATTNNQLKPYKLYVWRQARIEPEPHWWVASTLITVPFLLSEIKSLFYQTSQTH